MGVGGIELEAGRQARLRNPSRMPGRGSAFDWLCRPDGQGWEEMYPPPIRTVLVTLLVPACLIGLEPPRNASWNTSPVDVYAVKPTALVVPACELSMMSRRKSPRAASSVV